MMETPRYANRRWLNKKQKTSSSYSGRQWPFLDKASMLRTLRENRGKERRMAKEKVSRWGNLPQLFGVNKENQSLGFGKDNVCKDLWDYKLKKEMH